MKPNKRRGRPKEPSRVKADLNGKPFLRLLMDHPDLNDAKALLESQSGLEFDQEHIEDVERIGLECKEEQHLKVKNILDRSEEKLSKTKPRIKCSLLSGGEESQEVPFKEWRSRDKGIFVFSLCMAVLVLVTGSTNVYSNLMASGIPVFLENKILAILLCAVVPAGSASLKFFYDFLEDDAARATYAIVIYAFSGLTLLAWTVLFSIQFPGAAGGLDLNSLFEEGSRTETLFVWTQLATEIFCGAALFLVAGNTSARYSPDYTVRNLEYVELEKDIKSRREDLSALEKDVEEARGASKKLQSARQAYINRQVAEFISLRGRFKDNNHNF